MIGAGSVGEVERRGGSELCKKRTCRPSILSLSTCIYPMGVILTHCSHITPFRPF